MGLRNPNLFIYGTGYPQNVYVITNRFINPQENSTNVSISLRLYTDETKQYSPVEHQFQLIGLTDVPSELTPVLYEAQLLVQHGETVVDGTKLSDFIVLP